uniref:Uncharacterized protein n=1 Tax=Anguilla anguilla TaxID=7936 RepID=A0A0E9P871_ANGAN
MVVRSVGCVFVNRR